MPDLLVVQPDPLTGLDRFGGWLADAGASIRVVRPYAGEPVPRRLDAAGLVVLGGLMSVARPDRTDWPAAARDLMRQAISSERPLLGICLGAQMLAQAAGGTVAVGAQGTEAGAVRVDLTPAAAGDALFAGLPDPFVSGSFHSDAVSRLPPAAVLLGGSALYPHQAFRVGERAWGVQFHPELTIARYRSWVDAVPSPDPALAERLRRGADALVDHEPDLLATGAWLAQRFAALL